jgi:hypothetical protein
MRRWQFAAAMGPALVLPLAAFAQEAAPKVVAYLGTQFWGFHTARVMTDKTHSEHNESA